MILDRHTSALEHLLIKFPNSSIGCVLSGKLDIGEAFAVSPGICDHPAVGDVSIFSEFRFELWCRDFEEEVSHVQNPTRF